MSTLISLIRDAQGKLARVEEKIRTARSYATAGGEFGAYVYCQLRDAESELQRGIDALKRMQSLLKREAEQ